MEQSNPYDQKTRASRVYEWARKLGLGHDEAQEVVQDYRLAKLEGKAQFQKAKHFVVDWFRKNKYDSRLTTKPKPSDIESLDEVWDHQNISLAAKQDHWLLLSEKLDDMAPFDRVMVVLYYYWGMDGREISLVTGLNIQTVLRRLKELKGDPS